MPHTLNISVLNQKMKIVFHLLGSIKKGYLVFIILKDALLSLLLEVIMISTLNFISKGLVMIRINPLIKS